MPRALPPFLDAVIFDLDGALIDSEPDLRAALNRLLATLERRPVTRNEVTMMVGDGVAKLVERALAATGGVPAGGLERATETFMGFYGAAPADLSAPFPGAAAVVRGLDAAGAGLGVCTNKPAGPARGILRTFGLEAYFGVVIGGDSLPGIRKPDPRPLAAAIEALGTGPGRAVMVGDSANDIETAKALGVRSVAVSFGYSRRPVEALGADAVIDGFEELWAALEGLA